MLRVRDHLNEVFPQRWFESSIEWPSCSPNLTPMDFFTWGMVKNKVYEKNPKTVSKLKDYIWTPSEKLMKIEICHTVHQRVLKRCEECCNVGGEHFEHFSK